MSGALYENPAVFNIIARYTRSGKIKKTLSCCYKATLSNVYYVADSNVCTATIQRETFLRLNGKSVYAKASVTYCI